MEITIGMKGEAFTDVERSDTAAEVGSGSLLVYATPCMAALMEGAACIALENALAADDSAAMITALEATRKSADMLESVLDDKAWPLPKYREILFVY